MAMPRVATSAPKRRSLVLRDTHPANCGGATNAPDTTQRDRYGNGFTWLFTGDPEASDSAPANRVASPHPQHLAAVRTYDRIAREWNLSDSEAAGLLGMETNRWWNIKNSTRMISRIHSKIRGTRPVAHAANGVSKKCYEHLLNEDQLARIAEIGAIYSALQLMNMENNEPRWLIRENTEAVFDGKAPLHAMIDGGAAKIQEVRQHLEYQFSR